MLASGDYDVDEHFEARAVVDLELVRLCAERGRPRAAARILKLAVDGRAFHDDPVAFRLLDIEFHQSVYLGAGNRLLSALGEALYDMGLDLRRGASALPGVIEMSVRQHVEVAEAMWPATRRRGRGLSPAPRACARHHGRDDPDRGASDVGLTRPRHHSRIANRAPRPAVPGDPSGPQKCGASAWACVPALRSDDRLRR